ncbi:MAG: EutN/CcmL family microcompartment protein [Dehalobacterium sp.]|jgi:ethanolamine utilization protein EutN
MYIGKVIGHVVATKKDPKLVGHKLLIVSPLNREKEEQDSMVVAVDVVGAGRGEVVLLVKGSTARMTVGTDSPIDAAIIGIVDIMEV